jgi:hypothetical protein
MVVVFRHDARAEFPEPFELVLDAFAPQVEMDAVLDDLCLWYQLEEDPRLPARRLDQDTRVVLGVEDARAAQPGELRIIVRSDLVTVEDRGPEPGDRRGMVAIEDNIVKASHGRIMAQSSGDRLLLDLDMLPGRIGATDGGLAARAEDRGGTPGDGRAAIISWLVRPRTPCSRSPAGRQAGA